MTEKMREYLHEQSEKQEQAETNLILALSDGMSHQTILRYAVEAFKYSRYIRHGIFESQDCEHCKERGLV